MEIQENPQMFEEKLISDPNYLINFIIDNNLAEVRKRMTDLGYQDITTKDDAISVINELIEIQDVDTYKFVLSVPLKTEIVPKIYWSALENASNRAFIIVQEKLGNMLPLPELP
jgi:hypothetical protein